MHLGGDAQIFSSYEKVRAERLQQQMGTCVTLEKRTLSGHPLREMRWLADGLRGLSTEFDTSITHSPVRGSKGRRSF